MSAKKPTATDMSFAPHCSSYRLYATNSSFAWVDTGVFANRAKYDAILKDVEEYGSDHSKSIFSKRKHVIEECLGELDAKKPRLEAILTDAANAIKEATDPRKNALAPLATAMAEVRASKRMASAKKTMEKKRETDARIAAIIEPLKAIDEDMADNVFNEISMLIADVAKEAVANAYVPEE
jgi:hypothetical protein